MNYYIKVKWNNQEMYFTGQDKWTVKNSPFYSPAKFSLKEANKMVLKLKDMDSTQKYELEVA